MIKWINIIAASVFGGVVGCGCPHVACLRQGRHLIFFVLEVDVAESARLEPSIRCRIQRLRLVLEEDAIRRIDPMLLADVVIYDAGSNADSRNRRSVDCDELLIADIGV